MMRELGLFAGIGGFSLGLEKSGLARPVSFVEIDPFCQKVLRKHWPRVPCHDNVLTREFVEDEAEIITAGFPCQDISLAGTGAGLAGERSGLYREVVRAIRLVRPQYTILENVAALLSRGLGTVLGDLAEIGNDAEWHCIPASAVGAPHRRDRIWIIANPGGEQYESNRAPLSGAIAAQLHDSFADAKCDELWEQSGRSSGPDREGEAELRDYGAEGTLAVYSNASAMLWPPQLGGEPHGDHASPRELADASGKGCEDDKRCNQTEGSDWRRAANGGCRREGGNTAGLFESGLGRMANGSPARMDGHPGWAIEPEIPRTSGSTGRADRVHRLRSLGNSLVPQIPEIIGRAILKAQGSPHTAEISPRTHPTPNNSNPSPEANGGDL